MIFLLPVTFNFFLCYVTSNEDNDENPFAMNVIRYEEKEIGYFQLVTRALDDMRAENM